MSKLLISIVLIVFSFQIIVKAETYYYELRTEHREIYEDILFLKLDKAAAQLNQLKVSDPYNVSVFHLENYIDFYKTFILEQEGDFKSFEAAKKYRIDKIERCATATPYKLFAMAEIELQWALTRAKFGQEIKAGWDINRAYKWLNANKLLYPDFALNDKSLGIIHALIGSIKGLKRGLIDLFTSLDGSIEEGIAEVKSLYGVKSESTAFFREEIIAIRALTALHIESNSQQAYRIIMDRRLDDFDDSQLISFLRGSIARQAGYNDKVIMHLAKKKDKESIELPYNQLLLGTAYLNQMDGRAKEHLDRFIAIHVGRHYIKEAHQKLAWHYLLLNRDIDAYKKEIAKCLRYGEREIGEDEMAYHEAKSEIIPNVDILKAQLLYDGGQLQDALTVLQAANKDFWSLLDHINWNYRMGRALQGLQDSKALNYFDQVLHLDRGSDTYYACNAALQSGIILTEDKKLDAAHRYFEKCLSINSADHKKSLHQKARLWLQKLELLSQPTD